MQPKILRTEADHKDALTEIKRLWGASAASADQDRLEVLVLLVEDYETRTIAPVKIDPVDYIAAHMELCVKTADDLGALLGSGPFGRAVLSRKQPLTLPMIQALVGRWGMVAELLIAPYDTEPA